MAEQSEQTKEVDCKGRCGAKVTAFWYPPTSRWCYEGSGLCETCAAKEVKKERQEQWAKYAGITTEEMKLNIDNFVETPGSKEALDAAKRMALGDSINLFLTGQAGRGKTHLALAVLNAKSAKKVKFLPVTRWLMEVRSKITSSGEDVWIEKLMSLEALVLDDFGSTKLTDWSLSFLDCVVDEWYRRRKKGLIVTSNFTIKQVAETISDRIASRLKQICEVYEITGKDWRVNSGQ